MNWSARFASVSSVSLLIRHNTCWSASEKHLPTDNLWSRRGTAGKASRLSKHSSQSHFLLEEKFNRVTGL